MSRHQLLARTRRRSQVRCCNQGKMTSGRSARNSFQAVAEVCPETFAMLATEKDKTNTQLSQDKGGQEGKYIYIYIYSVPAPYKPYHDCWAECTLCCLNECCAESMQPNLIKLYLMKRSVDSDVIMMAIRTMMSIITLRPMITMTMMMTMMTVGPYSIHLCGFVTA